MMLLPGWLAAQDETRAWDPDAENQWQENGDHPALSPEELAKQERDPALGGLQGVIVYCGAGHGLTADIVDDYPEDQDKGWYTQRGLTNKMVEDYGNIDQLNFFAEYCLNAGATIVPTRPLGFQPNEVVLDNTSEGVTFTGNWKDSKSSIYYGEEGAVPYRYATTSSDETATARYTPNIPEAGFYPIYTWARQGLDRVEQVYRIHTANGDIERTVDHRRVGRGWVWLGNYYFEKGTDSGWVEISNTNTNNGVVIADAIRFGNGIGDVDRGEGVSGYPREFEAARYWIETMLGQSADPTIIDIPDTNDQGDNVGAPPRMTSKMNVETVGDYWDRVYVSFHTNASGTRRGALTLFNEKHPTARQKDYATVIHDEVSNDLEALDEGVAFAGDWDDTTGVIYGGINYGEIRNTYLNKEFTATIVEVAYHDKADDAALMLDPVVRNYAARATYQGVVKFLNEATEGRVPATLLPDPPVNVKAIILEDGKVEVSWQPAQADGVGGDAATGYIVENSVQGLGFRRNMVFSGATTTSMKIDMAQITHPIYFQVRATNEGGTSLPSKVVGVYPGKEKTVLIVDAQNAFDKSLGPIIMATSNLGSTKGGGGTTQILRTAFEDSRREIVDIGRALAANETGFVSCTSDAVMSGDVSLASHPAVIWINGNAAETTEVFKREKAGLAHYIRNGGRLFVTGGPIVWNILPGGKEQGVDVRYNLLTESVSPDKQRATLRGIDETAMAGTEGIDIALDRRDVFSTKEQRPTDNMDSVNFRSIDVYTQPTGGYSGVEAQGANFRLINFVYPLQVVYPEEKRAEVVRRALEYVTTE